MLLLFSKNRKVLLIKEILKGLVLISRKRTDQEDGY
jgi:hypothetical protein